MAHLAFVICMKLALILICVWSFSLLGSQAQEETSIVDIPLLREYAQHGNAEAQFELGIRLIEGELVEKNPKEAAKWLELAVKQKHPEAMNALGTLYEQGLGVAQNDKKAFELYEASAAIGFVLGQHNLSECFSNGRGVAKNEKEANRWLLKAAKQEFGPSQALYAWKLEEGQGGLVKNTKEAATWYLRAAQNAHGPSITHMAYLYYIGRGVPQDFRRAAAWYKRAIRTEDPWAKNDFAWFLSVCPDANFHDPDMAVQLAQSSLSQLEKPPYQIVDTLAAALARQGKFGEAVQWQIKSIAIFHEVTFGKEMGEDGKKLLNELNARLADYRKQTPFTEVPPTSEAGTIPLIDDRILQEEGVPRNRRFLQPPQQKQERRSIGGDDSVVKVKGLMEVGSSLVMSV